MKKKTSFFIFSIFFSILIIGGFFWWNRGLKPADLQQKEKQYFTVSRGDGLNLVVYNLSKAGLIKNTLHFKIFSYFFGFARNIKAGGYYLSPSMPPKEILGLLSKGTDDKWATIVEGLRSEEIGQMLIKSGFAIDPEKWQKQIKSSDLEGQLFPDSYLIPNAADLEKILQIFEKNFDKKVLAGLGSEIQKSGMDINEILTLSSIIEREAKTDSDKKIIAGILIKRIENDWPLQVDASVQYAVGSKNCSILKSPCEWWSQVTSNDLKINSPYNSYLNKSLPPGPICNPGLSSIKAVLSPQDSDFWYYISDYEGKMHYAKTGEEHQQNIEKYLR